MLILALPTVHTGDFKPRDRFLHRSVGMMRMLPGQVEQWAMGWRQYVIAVLSSSSVVLQICRWKCLFYLMHGLGFYMIKKKKHMQYFYPPMLNNYVVCFACQLWTVWHPFEVPTWRTTFKTVMNHESSKRICSMSRVLIPTFWQKDQNMMNSSLWLFNI